jgi:hypothetical protein
MYPGSKKFGFNFLFALIVLDFIGVSLGFFTAYFIQFGTGGGNLFTALQAYSVYSKIFLFNSFLWLLSLNLFGLYQLEKKERLSGVLLILLGTTLGMLLSLAAVIIFQEFTYTKKILFIAWIFSTIFLFILRTLFKKYFLK